KSPLILSKLTSNPTRLLRKIPHPVSSLSFLPPLPPPFSPAHARTPPGSPLDICTSSTVARATEAARSRQHRGGVSPAACRLDGPCRPTRRPWSTEEEGPIQSPSSSSVLPSEAAQGESSPDGMNSSVSPPPDWSCLTRRLTDLNHGFGQ